MKRLSDDISVIIDEDNWLRIQSKISHEIILLSPSEAKLLMNYLFEEKEKRSNGI